MAYIGKEPGSGLRGRFVYTATAGQTSFTGSDSLGRTLTYTDSEYTDVFLNGVKLDKTDYTATSGTSIVLDSGASANDTLEILAFDTFGLFSGEFAQDVSVGGDLTISDKIIHSGDTNTTIRFADADTVTVETGGSERMRITSGGNIQIGSTNSGVAGSIDVSIGSTSSSGGITLFSPTNGTHSIGFADGTSGTDRYRGYIEYQHTNDAMAFATQSTERCRIDNIGNLLIGKTSTSVSDNGAIIKPSGEYFATTAGANTYHYYDSSNSRYNFYVLGNGGIANYSSNNVGLSDQTEKKNIVTASSAWDNVKALSVKEFHYNFEDDADPKRLGVIAQEVQVNHPSLVTSFDIDDSTTKLGVVEQQITWMAIKALQEAQAKIEALEARVATLEGN